MADAKGKDVTVKAENTKDIGADVTSDPDPRRGLPKAFDEVSGKPVDFSHKAIRKVWNHPEVREYGLNPIVVERRGLRGRTPTTKKDVQHLVSQGILSKDEANTFDYDNHGYVRQGDTIMSWMPEEHARKREAEMKKRAERKEASIRQAARDRIMDAARDLPGVDVSFDEVETEEETMHFVSDD